MADVHDSGEDTLILAVNGGSSSLKFAAFRRGDPASALARGKVERIGLDRTRLRIDGGEERDVEAADLAGAAAPVLDWVDGRFGLGRLAAVGHRVVHGGPVDEPVIVDADVLAALRKAAPLDPDHVPGELDLIRAFADRLPGLPQVACFDTTFHRDLPRVARIVPIPRRYEEIGVRRYGFHGLSYAFLVEELARLAGPDGAPGRVILAHLGSGASLAAVRDGRCVETTMGFTPASGLVMGTRSGDLDPGLAPFLARAEGMTPERFDRMANRESGLLGVSGTSPDLRDLLAREADDPRAAEAVDLFCYRARLAIGSLAAALGGVDALVFSGGIGENSAEARRRIADGLGFLGIALDDGRNRRGEPVLSADGARVPVRVIPTDEERMIARAAESLIAPA